MSHTTTHAEAENKTKAVKGVLNVLRRELDTSTAESHYKKMTSTGLILYDEHGISYLPIQCFEAMKEVIDRSTVSKDMLYVVHAILDELIEDCKQKENV